MRLKAFFIAFEEISSGEKKNNNSKKEGTRFKLSSYHITRLRLYISLKPLSIFTKGPILDV